MFVCSAAAPFQISGWFYDSARARAAFCNRRNTRDHHAFRALPPVPEREWGAWAAGLRWHAFHTFNPTLFDDTEQ